MGTIGKETASTAQRVPFTFCCQFCRRRDSINIRNNDDYVRKHNNDANTRTTTKNNEDTRNRGSGSNSNNETNDVLILTTPAMTLTAL